jgi:hypothetical protein
LGAEQPKALQIENSKMQIELRATPPEVLTMLL